MKIKLYTDYACPFCMIQRKIIKDAGLEEHFESCFKQIHPELPLEGAPASTEHDPEYVSQVNDQLNKCAEQFGLQLAMSDYSSNSQRAIIIRAYIAEHYPDKLDEYDGRIFTAYNVNKENISAFAVLNAITGSLNIPETAETMAEDPDAYRRYADDRFDSEMLHINVTPSFVIGRQVAPGVYPAEYLKKLIEISETK